MKKRNHLLLGASLLIASSALIGCSTGQEDSSKLIIHGSNMGYGVKWMSSLIDDFTKETGIQVSFKAFDAEQGISTLMNEIEKGSDTDIIFTKINNYFKHAYEGKFLDLTPTLTEKDPANGNTSIEERTETSFREFHKIKVGGEDKYYGISWANGVFGIVRNINMWEELKLTDADMPYTTDELLALCQKVVDKDVRLSSGFKVSPFINSYSAEYYTSLMPVWFMQYEGPENMSYFQQALDPEYPLRPITVNPDCSSFYERDGIKASLTVLQKLILDNPSYQHALSDGYPSFKSLQDDFLKSRNALFMPNGSWLESETTVKDYNVDFIPTPIVSSIIDKVDVEGNKVFTTINDDATLSAVVKYIRGGKVGAAPAGVNEHDILEIEKSINYSSYVRNGFDHQMVIPANTDKAEEATKFIKFMYSDRGLNKYYKYTNGGLLCTAPSSGHYETEGTEISEFRKKFNDILNEGHLGPYEICNKNKAFCYGGVGAYFNNGLVQEGVSAVNNVYYAMRDSKRGAEFIYNANKTYLRKNWASIFAKIPQ